MPATVSRPAPVAALGLALAVTAGAVSPGRLGAQDSLPHSELELVSEVASIEPGRPFTVGLRFTLEPGWHTYWLNPGDAGLPLVATWTLPEGLEAGPVEWPVPHRIPWPPLMSFGWEEEVTLPVRVTPAPDLEPGREVTLAVEAEFQVCADVCIPVTAERSLVLPVSDGAAAPHPAWADRLAAARAALPREAEGWSVHARRVEGGYVLEVEPPAGVALPDPYLFVDSMYVVEHAPPQEVERDGDGRLRIRLVGAAVPGPPQTRFGGVLVADAASPEGAGAWWVEAPLDEPARVAEDTRAAGPSPGTASGGGTGLTLALLFAFLGGAILNLMPCVFPVLSVKVLGFVEHGAGHPARARRHGLAFGAGVLVSLWLLAGVLVALRAGGGGPGWGYQLQSPLVVALLATLVFVLGLNLSGVFEVGVGLTRLGAAGAGSGYRDSFLTGGLTVAVATPCTAPFMGAALGYALVQPAAVALAVFTALGVGLAAPYVVLSAAPSLLRRLPRPGPWMDGFKQLLAFPMYLTAVWLVWVFARLSGPDAAALLLVGFTAAALAGWLVGRAAPAPSPMARAGIVLAALAAVAAPVQAARWGVTPAPSGSAATSSSSDATPGLREPWSAARVAELRAQGRAVFVDFTAAWCLSCQVNERVALGTRTVERAFAERGVAFLTADWTARDPEIARALESFGRSGVPLYVLYPADPRGEAEILPALLTPSLVLEALERATAAP